VTEHAFPLAAAVAELLVLVLLIPTRNAARMPLGGVHLGAPPLERGAFVGLCAGAVSRPAPWLVAVRRHRSSIRSKLAFSSAYHLITG
jgi:hypothetical protein